METEDLTEALSVEALLYEWGRLFRVSVRGAPLCCFSSMGALGGPLGASTGTAATAAAAAAAGVVLFIGRATRILSRGGRWGEKQRQRLAPIAHKIVRRQKETETDRDRQRQAGRYLERQRETYRDRETCGGRETPGETEGDRAEVLGRHTPLTSERGRERRLISTGPCAFGFRV